MKSVIWTWLLLILITLNPAFAGHTDPGVQDPKKAMDSILEAPSDPIALLNIPKELAVAEAKKALTAEGTTIVEVSRFDFDPTNRIVIFEGVSELPADILADMNEIGGIETGDQTLSRHKFSIHFELPSAKKIALTRYFQIRIRSLKLGNQDYTPAVHLLGRYAVGLLLNTSFMNYMLEVKPEVQLTEKNPSLLIKQLIENKGLRFRGDTISFKVDLSQIPQLSAYAGLEGIRVWGVHPTILRGTKGQVALRIEAGIGRPNKAWIKQADKRHSDEVKSLEDVREELYKDYSDLDVLMADLEPYKKEMAETLGFTHMSIRHSDEFKGISRKVRNRAAKYLNKREASFLADPETTYYLVKDELKELIAYSLSDIRRRQLIEQANLTGGAATTTLPFLEKRLSQKTIDEAARFFREFEFEGDQMFPDLSVVIDPKNKGIILRGNVAIDINVLMALGMEGSGIEWSKVPLRIADDQYGSGLPFEAGVRISMGKKSELGIDVHYLKLADGSNQIYLTNDSDHANVAINYIKLALTQTLVTTLIEQPIVPPGEETGDEEENDYDPYKEILANISKQIETYSTLGGHDLLSLLDVAKIDIEKNPFILEGKEFVAGKTELFFEKLIRFDDEDKQLKINLSPRIVSEKIMESDNNIAVWNIEPIYDKVMNQTYIDLAVGNGDRSTKYENLLKYRPENKDSQLFKGIDTSRKQSPADLHVKMNLEHFENLINQIFKDAFVAQNKVVEKALKERKVSDHYLVKNINLNVIRDGELRVNMVLSHIKKGKRFFLNPARIWSGDFKDPAVKTITASMNLQLSVEKLSKYINEIKFAENEIFLSDELLRLDVSKVGLKFDGQTSVLDKIVGLVAKDIDFKRSSIAKKLKVFLLKFAGKFMNERDPKKNGNLELGGFKINQYVKMFTHDEEILLQLNPHAGGNAFDIKLIPNQKFNGADLGLIVKKRDNSIAFDFSTAGNMASVDKGELASIIEKSVKIFAPYKEAQTAEELRKLMSSNMLFDQTFYNSDYAKMSLLHRFKRVISQYPGITDIAGIDMDVIEQINRNLGTDIIATKAGFNGRAITNSGVEIMYFLIVAVVLEAEVDSLIEKLKSQGLTDVSYFEDFVKYAKKLRENYIVPFMEIYTQKFDRHNKKIIKKGPTDWNHSYYPDARFSNEVYERVKGNIRIGN